MMKMIKKIIAITLAATMLAAIPVYAQTDPSVTTTIAVPEISSEAAILMDANTGKILYEKNADTTYYPASITKMMTALLVIERCNLDDKVTFSKIATTNLEAGAVTLGVSEGDVISVRDCLYGLMLKSANEIANGLAEHVGGTVSGFSDMMNAKAAELGCTHTHFVNPNGLNNTQHFTTPHDMALIAKACFANSTFREIDGTLTYTFPATKNNPNTTAISIGHKMLYPSDARYYEGVFGGKTGYTSKAGNTLVTGAKKDGVELIVVIMKSKQTQYADTKALLDYGFAIDKDRASASPATETASGPGSMTDNTSIAPATSETDSEPVKTTDSSTTVVGIGPGVHGWIQVADKWYYIDDNGYMLRDTTTPDGYKVNSEGVWIESK